MAAPVDNVCVPTEMMAAPRRDQSASASPLEKTKRPWTDLNGSFFRFREGEPPGELGSVRSEQVNTKLIEYNRDGSEDAGVLTARAQQADARF